VPRIKSPINQQEKDYNKRYEHETQCYYLSQVNKAYNSRKFYPDAYTRNFLRSISESLDMKLELTDKTADFLAELYDKYSD